MSKFQEILQYLYEWFAIVDDSLLSSSLYFFLTFLDQSSLRRVGNQNITEICSSENGCYNFKLTIPTGNYESHEYLAEEMQNSIDNFEKGILKKFNAHITMTYDHLSQRFKISAQNERLVRLYSQNHLLKS